MDDAPQPSPSRNRLRTLLVLLVLLGGPLLGFVILILAKPNG